MVREIDVRSLAEKMQGGDSVCLVDVRQPWEHATAVLPCSRLIPLGELPARAREIEAPAEALVVVYCHHGIRSLSGAALLERLGFVNVVSLAGGIDAWSLHVDPRVPRY